MTDYSELFDDNEKLMNLTLVHKTFIKVVSKYWKPSVDIYENTDSFLVFVELAGLEKDRIKIEFHNGFLTISGVRKPVVSDYSAVTHQMEIDTGKFMRKIRIVADIPEKEITAEYREGILKILLPKR